MRLFIAEKPSLARAIADVLGVKARHQPYIECTEDTITWCFGHLLEMASPEDYGVTAWDRDSLPIMPGKWKNKPRAKVKTQLSAIEGLLKKASSVVHAGDPDREGQLLVDEVLELFHYTGPIQRIWLSSLDATSVRNALNNLKPNVDYTPLRDAAIARGRADWLVGINATRAMTILGRESGHCSRQEVLSIGRVQTPTLALVVGRDKQIEAFKPQPYLDVQGTFTTSAESDTFSAKYLPGSADNVDDEGRLLDRKRAQEIASKAKSTGHVISVREEQKTRTVPLPHCLSSLQKTASAKLGMTAQKTLDTAQSLYEKKLTTYPRSDCRYLPEEQFAGAAQLVAALGQVPELKDVAAHADVSIHGAVWNTSKVTAHHAIIPTGEHLPADLSEQERSLYVMIAQAYVLQFFPSCEYTAQTVTIDVDGDRWEGRGRVVTTPGWTAYYQSQTDGDEPLQALPPLKETDELLLVDVTIQAKKTTPPKRFTEGSLIDAMAHVHRYLDEGQSQAKTALKETEGLGTEATRAGIIETLKVRGYIEAKKKTLVSTDRGRTIIDLCPSTLKDPLMTAQWETRLASIARGDDDSLDAFMRAQEAALPSLLEPILNAKVKPLYPCPQCGGPLIRKNGSGGFYWACFEKEKHRNGRPLFFSDVKGKPELEKKDYPCPRCGQPLKRFRRKDGTMLWGCFNAEAHARPQFFEDNHGKPAL